LWAAQVKKNAITKIINKETPQKGRRHFDGCASFESQSKHGKFNAHCLEALVAYL